MAWSLGPWQNSCLFLISSCAMKEIGLCLYILFGWGKLSSNRWKNSMGCEIIDA